MFTRAPDENVFGFENPIPADHMSEVSADFVFFPSIAADQEPIIADVIFIDNYGDEHRIPSVRFRHMGPPATPQLSRNAEPTVPGRRSPASEETSNKVSAIPSFPGGTPTSLRHILEVVRLVRVDGYTRTDATQLVAKQYDIFPQTVLDKYCRQLELTTDQFDRLLHQKDLTGLRATLRSKFPGHTEVIEGLLPRSR